MKKFCFSLIIANVFFASSYAQSVSINNDGLAPDGSAMLDVRSPAKGLLIPRVTLQGTDDVATIPSPATSLLVFNTTANGTGNTAVIPGYYYWSGTAWLILNTGSGSGSPTATSWLLGGNAGTDASVNFLGTTDARPLHFKVNNVRSGYIGAPANDGNIFWGYQSGLHNTGYSNIGLGINALFTNTTISNLVAIGDSALYSNTTGTENTVVGSKALFLNSTGFGNTANGSYALNSNTTGNVNTANGASTLYFNTTGSNNCAYGVGALQSNISGVNNTASGNIALLSNTTGNNNTANGVSALLSNTTGGNNTGSGQAALYSNTTGTFNTALGYKADVSSGDLTNATALGYGAIADASNKVRIGNSDVRVIEGQVAYSFPSDARFKYNIQDNVPGLEFIKKLTPVTYYFDEQGFAQYTKTGILNNSLIRPASYNTTKQLHTGFLAQDVEKIATELGYSFDGIHSPVNDKDHYSLAYSQFIMPLVKSVQEQQQIIDDQNKKIDSQADEITRMNENIKRLQKAVEILTHHDSLKKSK